jgi:hypothetical protein
MVQHTPGPWLCQHEQGGLSKIMAPAGRVAFTIELPLVNAPKDGRAIGLEEAQANACLIAAAPEMLEALKALQLQALQSNVNDPANEWGREALVMAQVTIDKAEGR